MTEALIRELELRKGDISGTVDTVYFGGGTPSVLSIDELNSILKKINNSFNISPTAEITIEANPEDIDRDYAESLVTLGFNRVSLGVQTFHGDLLQYINRSHSPDKAREAVGIFRDAGIVNINLDLIYALPGSDAKILQSDLEDFQKLDTPHISIYAFTLEENTVFGKWAKKGMISPANEDEEASQFSYIIRFLKENGYEQYEVSNFCKPGYESRHNSSYWRGIPYLGIGPGAHSFNGVLRWWNIRQNAGYVRSISQNKLPAEREDYSILDMVNDRIITGLRTKWGVDLRFLNSEYGISLLKEKGGEIEIFIKDKKMEMKGNIIFLTEEGFFFADKIAGDLMI